MSDVPPTPLALFLAENDVPCPNPKCGFNLRGLKDATCPECKEPLNLAVRRPEALWYMRKWVVAAAIVSLASAALQAEDETRAIRAEYGAPWIDWTDWLTMAVSLGVSLGLAAILARYAWQRRHGNTRGLPLLLRGLLVSILVLLGMSVFWYGRSILNRWYAFSTW